MFTTNQRCLSWKVLLMACVLGVNGCAHQQAETNTTEATASTTSSSTSKPADRMQSAVADDKQPALPDYLTLNPISLTFEKSSIKLSDESKQMVERLIERAKAVGDISIIGYCDRTQIGNAKDAAIARAVAVKREFVRLGVPAKTIRIRYNTETANKHAADIKF